MNLMRINFLASLTGKKNQVKDKNPYHVYLNSKHYIDFSRPENCRIAIYGSSGFGKTWTIGEILSYAPIAVNYFDPQPSLWKNLGKQNNSHLWDRFVFCDKVKSKEGSVLKINSSELNGRIINVLAGKMDTSSRKVKLALQKMFKEKANRTYDDLRLFLKQEKLEYVFQELESILHPNDDGFPLQHFLKGKKVIDISQVPKQDKSVALLTELLFGYKQAKNDTSKVMFFIDECQLNATNNSENGRAFGTIASRGRVFSIYTGVGGVVPKNLDTTLRGQLNTFILFKLTEENLKSLREQKSEIDLREEDFNNLGAGYGKCFYYCDVAGKMQQPKAIKLNIEMNRKEPIKESNKLFSINYGVLRI